MFTIVNKYNRICADGFEFNPAINKYGHSTKKPFQWLLMGENALWGSQETSEEQKDISESDMIQDMVEMVDEMACEDEEA